MKLFKDETGRSWVATSTEEDTARHHGRWYLILHPEDDARTVYAVPEIRWKNAETAARTLRTMSDSELRRRLASARLRHTSGPGSGYIAENRAAREHRPISAG